MLLQALHVKIEMKHLNLQVTLVVQKGVGTRSPHYTLGSTSNCLKQFCECLTFFFFTASVVLELILNYDLFLESARQNGN